MSKLAPPPRLDRARPKLDTTASPAALPSPALPRTLVEDTHSVPLTPLPPPNRPRLLRFTALQEETSTVALTDPVQGTFPLTKLLIVSDTPPKLALVLKLDRVRQEVHTTDTLISLPNPIFPRTLLEEVHTVPEPPLPPHRNPTLRLQEPTLITKTLRLVDPVAGPFPRTTLLKERDTTE